MERRTLLQKSGSIIAVAVGGCIGQDTPASGTETKRESKRLTAETISTTSSREREQNSEEATTKSGRKRYLIGETHTHQDWKITIVDFDLKSSFQTDEGGKYEAPPRKKLLTITVRITNLLAEKRSWAGMPFAAIFDKEMYGDKRGFRHPEFEGYVSMDDLKSIEHGRQYAPESYPLEPGETAAIWGLFLVPDEAGEGELLIGFDSSANDQITYPIRWTLNQTQTGK